MQIINQIGHVQYWGMSPAANILKFNKQESFLQQPYRILMSGCSDIRHILKTLCDIHLQQQSDGIKRYSTIQIYFHETNKQLLCRCLLFLHIIHEINLSFEERIQIFLDLYGNSLIKERNARYLHNLREDLLNFIHAQKNVVTPLKNFVNLKLLRFQERDQLSEIIQSWSSKIPFQMEKLRDQRLRYMFKERYDYRANLIDWDFNMMLTECAPIVHFYHYKEWRLTGLAYEQRFSKYTEPNRTLSSYADGKKKQEKTSCLVRGFWGDIMMSPYIALGTKCDSKQSDLLFKKANYKYIGHSVQLTEYNMNYWLTMLQKQQEYFKIFRDYYRADEETKKQLEKKNQTKKKKKDVKEIKEVDQEEDIEDTAENVQEGEKDLKKQTQQLSKTKKSEDLDSDQEEQKKKVDVINSKQINYSKQEKPVLKGFTDYNLSVHLLGMNSEKLIQPKFKQFFDLTVLGFIHSAYLGKGVQSIIKKGGIFLVQKANYLIPKKKEERKQLNEKLKSLIEKQNIFKQIVEDQDFFAYKKI